MKRRQFIKRTAIASIASLMPLSLWSQDTMKYSKDILIGNANPELFGNGYNLLKPAHEALDLMKVAAAKEGINIKVVSSYRNFAHQKRIWERKFKRFTGQGMTALEANKKIIEYSTIPGTSRHHWGTDMDIIDANQPTTGDVLVPSKFHGDGPFCKLKEWMDDHAQDFGFSLVYTDVEGRKGFKYEPWHYSFSAISIPMLKAYRELDIKSILVQEELVGSEAFSKEFIKDYISQNILDINPKLL